jgi:hypothetical protein
MITGYVRSVKQLLLPIRTRQNRLTIGNQRNHFLNKFQIKQTDQTNLWYEFNLDITCQSNT